MFRKYYNLTKPGIIYGNAVAAVAGFLLASKTNIDLQLLLAVIVGISLVMASACVFNNYIDQSIDKKMARTKKRALVEGTISGRNALIYATILGIIGFSTLITYTNQLTVLVGVIGFVDYIILYGIFKRRSIYGTLVGSISGATPPVAGYVAVTNHFDGGALLLFLAMVFWQMPHFYAIAMYRIDDYKAASIPVLPIIKGNRLTKQHILFYILAFSLTAVCFTIFGYTGYLYLFVMLGVCAWWLKIATTGFSVTNNKRWARKVFSFSLIVLITFSVLLSLNVVLP